MTDQTTRLPVRRALISVSDKTGIVDFARELTAQGVEILSTGGTYKLLCEQGIKAVEVADYTGFPEMMDGRVKTLHPKIHGGILGRRDLERTGFLANRDQVIFDFAVGSPPDRVQDRLAADPETGKRGCHGLGRLGHGERHRVDRTGGQEAADDHLIEGVPAIPVDVDPGGEIAVGGGRCRRVPGLPTVSARCPARYARRRRAG
mgnify:CR=1 FL=1